MGRWTPKKRVLSAIAGERVDRVPATSVSQTGTYEQMEKIGVWWPEAHLNAENMARLAMAAYELTGLETAKVPFEQTIEAEAMGCKLRFEKDIPAVIGPAFKDLTDLRIPDDFLSLGRIPVVGKAVELLKERVGDRLPVMASMVGPFSLAGMLMNMTAFFLLVVKNINLVKDVLNDLIELSISYANFLRGAGADVIVIEDMMASQVSPQVCGEVILPTWKELRTRTGGLTVLHVCGNATLHLEMMVESGVDAISVEEKTRLEAAVKAARGKAAVIGNVDPVKTLFMGEETDVEREAKEAIRGGVDLLAPGCSLAPGTPLKNIRAMVKAAETYGYKRGGEE
ncbi:MAG: MtaA/CmuA family methyltransferase [Candidatus Bathyarchaeia archaeon]